MTRRIFLFYYAVSFILSFYAVYSKDFHVAFNYEKLISYADLYNAMVHLSIGVIIFLVSYYFHKENIDSFCPSVTLDYYDNSSNLMIFKKKDIYILIVQFVILSHVLYMVLNSNENMISGNIVRIISSKVSQVMCLIQAALYIMSTKRIKYFIFICCIIIGLSFAWFDGSRAAVLPLLGGVFLSMRNRNKIKFFLFIILVIYFYMLATVSRVFNYEEKFSLDSFFYGLSLLNEYAFLYFKEIISYTTAFSILHFSYAIKTNISQFGFVDFIYSVLPIPSKILNNFISVNTSNWRIDLYRPMGGISQLYQSNVILLYFYYYILGFISSKIDSMNDRYFYLKMLLILVFSLNMISIFQYNLRSVQWFLWFMFFVLISYRKKIKINTNSL